MKSCSVWSKRRDQYQSDNCETNDKTKPFITAFFVSFDFGCEKKSSKENGVVGISCKKKALSEACHLVFAFKPGAS